jgi:hypothetical protein
VDPWCIDLVRFENYRSIMVKECKIIVCKYLWRCWK